MSLWIRILLVLTTLPLLQPPGLCCCRAIVRTTPEAPPVEVATSVKKCRCCAPRTEPSVPPTRDTSPCRPGCPLLAGVDQTQHIEPVTQLLDLVLAPIAMDVPLVPALIGQFRISVPIRSSGPPLHLSQCAYLC